jgi:hypothetical protein
VVASHFPIELKRLTLGVHAFAGLAGLCLQSAVRVPQGSPPGSSVGAFHIFRSSSAFCDALADNQGVVEVLGNDQLKVIAHELLKGLKANVSIGWAHRDSARARLRILVKRILRTYCDPPEPEEAAVRSVPARAEALLSTGDITL